MPQGSTKARFWDEKDAAKQTGTLKGVAMKLSLEDVGLQKQSPKLKPLSCTVIQLYSNAFYCDFSAGLPLLTPIHTPSAFSIFEKSTRAGSSSRLIASASCGFKGEEGLFTAWTNQHTRRIPVCEHAGRIRQTSMLSRVGTVFPLGLLTSIDHGIEASRRSVSHGHAGRARWLRATGHATRLKKSSWSSTWLQEAGRLPKEFWAENRWLGALKESKYTLEWMRSTSWCLLLRLDLSCPLPQRPTSQSL